MGETSEKIRKLTFAVKNSVVIFFISVLKREKKRYLAHVFLHRVGIIMFYNEVGDSKC